MPYSIILTAEKQDESQLSEVKEVLESIPGKYLEYQLKKGSKGPFIPSPKSTGPLSEAEFFSWMQEFRTGFDVGDGQILVFLTSQPIANRHFNGIDFQNRNIFVDLNNWEKLLVGNHPIKYPIAFHVLISMLIVIYFKEEAGAKAALHQEDMGCILDFNRKKVQVDLKLLTARICPTCMDTFLNNLPDINLLAYFRSGLEKIRHDIVEGEYYRKIEPKPIKVIVQEAYSKKSVCRIYFENMGAIQLDVAHTVVYLYFLQKKQGLYLSTRGQDFYFLNQLYEELAGFNNSKLVAKLCGLKEEDGKFKAIKSNAISERISKINREVSVLLGTFGLEQYYQILKRPNEKHGVDPQLVVEDETGILKRVERHLGKLKV
jgi:hypothetical protein